MIYIILLNNFIMQIYFQMKRNGKTYDKNETILMIILKIIFSSISYPDL